MVVKKEVLLSPITNSPVLVTLKRVLLDADALIRSPSPLLFKINVAVEVEPERSYR